MLGNNLYLDAFGIARCCNGLIFPFLQQVVTAPRRERNHIRSSAFRGLIHPPVQYSKDERKREIKGNKRRPKTFNTNLPLLSQKPARLRLTVLIGTGDSSLPLPITTTCWSLFSTAISLSFTCCLPLALRSLQHHHYHRRRHCYHSRHPPAGLTLTGGRGK